MSQNDGVSSNVTSQNDGSSSNNQDLSALPADSTERPDSGYDTMAKKNSASTDVWITYAIQLK